MAKRHTFTIAVPIDIANQWQYSPAETVESDIRFALELIERMDAYIPKQDLRDNDCINVTVPIPEDLYFKLATLPAYRRYDYDMGALIRDMIVKIESKANKTDTHSGQRSRQYASVNNRNKETRIIE